MPEALRNIGLIIRREYLQRLRTRAFWVMTFFIPAMMAGFTLLPSKLMTMKVSGVKRIIVVSDDPQLAEGFKEQFIAKGNGSSEQYSVETDSTATDAELQRLKSQAANKKFDGFVWLTKDAVAGGKVNFYTRSTADFEMQERLSQTLFRSVVRQRVLDSGAIHVDVDNLLKRVQLNEVSVEAGKSTGGALFFTTVLLVAVLYTTVIVHGVAVMRSVLEEKTSRVMEVMLATVTPKELMAGKMIGVGAVGLTQIAVWAIVAAIARGSAMAAASAMGESVHLSPATSIYFTIFYVLGFMLYSSMSAALGAMVNSDEEAQQLSFVVVMPIVVAMMFMMVIFRAPSAPLSVALSLVPFFAPILMFMRIMVEQPPMWQIVLCIALMIATIYVVLSICARIYRVGILMYGKRPTLPEIIKWVKYA
ncbi:MAG TPA: ABC transporter permease [Terriglobales bacterium]|jgi:ABC-2 type transport system permease protein|nr:ABC transporter permease [Terriglobales bacterium]